MICSACQQTTNREHSSVSDAAYTWIATCRHSWCWNLSSPTNSSGELTSWFSRAISTAGQRCFGSVANLGSGGIFQLLDHHWIRGADARHIIYHVAAGRIQQRRVFFNGIGSIRLIQSCIGRDTGFDPAYIRLQQEFWLRLDRRHQQTGHRYVTAWVDGDIITYRSNSLLITPH